jgi:bla regulator protein BlaR1
MRIIHGLPVGELLQIVAFAGLVALAAEPLSKALAQEATQPSMKEQKQHEFSTVSIRRGEGDGAQQPGTATPDGYRMRNMFLAFPLMTAYVPQTGGASMYADDQVVGMPAWMTGDTDLYDIDAKVDEGDLGDWQNPALQPGMLREMLQSMLRDRLKLAVHRSSKTGPVYALVVAKSGPKFKQTNPNDAHAGSYPFPGGGRIAMETQGDQIKIRYFGITIAQLASMWSGMEGRPVEDRTGLTGKYDVTIQKPAHPVTPGAPNGQGDNADSSVYEQAEQLGLKLESAKGEIETLVIDHVQHPSEN